LKKVENGELLLEAKDNGKGLPSGFKIENSDSLGLRLIHSLTDQINGQIEVDGSQGAHFSIKFHEQKRGKRK
jgi:two-component sensor histidine kinase